MDIIAQATGLGLDVLNPDATLVELGVGSLQVGDKRLACTECGSCGGVWIIVLDLSPPCLSWQLAAQAVWCQGFSLGNGDAGS